MFTYPASKLSGVLLRPGGKRKESLHPLEFEFHLQFPCGSPSTKLPNFRQSARSANEREYKQTLKKHVPRVMTSLLMSFAPISISHRCRYSNSRDVVASSPSFSRPAAKAPRRACTQVNVHTAPDEFSTG